MMQVLITGGAGFIGSRLSSALLEAGHEVTAFDSLHPQVHRAPFVAVSGAGLFIGDVSDAASWDRYLLQFGAPEVVVHLAAETGTGQSLNEATRHGMANVVRTTQMTDAFVRHDVRPQQILLASSRAVYGEGAWMAADGTVVYPGPRSGSQLAREQWDPELPGGAGTPVGQGSGRVEPRPTNVYAATKLAQEHLLESWCSAYEIPLSILRLQNVYGPGQAVGNAYTGVLTFFARQTVMGQQLEVFEDGAIVRDFVFVDDVVSALAAAIARPAVSIRRVDVGGGGAVTLLDVANEMSSLARADAPIVTGAYRLGDVRSAFADLSAARSELDWEPRVDLSAGLRALLDCVPSQL